MKRSGAEMTWRIYPAGYCGHWPEFTHIASKTSLRTACSSRGRLLPSDTVFLSRSSTVAVLAEFAGPAAHAALLARELGIPCVGGIPKLLETVHTGDVVLVNGIEGIAVINPDSRSLQRYEGAVDEVRKRNKRWYKTAASSDSYLGRN